MVKLVGGTLDLTANTRTREYEYDLGNPKDIAIIKKIDRLIGVHQSCLNCIYNHEDLDPDAPKDARYCEIYGPLGKWHDLNGANCPNYK